MKYAFVLGREYKLSLAELIAVFGRENLVDFSREIAIFELENSPKNRLPHLGGTTRIIEIISETSPEKFATDTLEYIGNNFHENKITFALANFGLKMSLSEIGMRMKKTLVKDFSVRFLNTKNENIHSAVFKREKLGRSETEFAIISVNFEEKNLQKNHDKKTFVKNEKFEAKNLHSNEEVWSFSQKFYFGKTIACQDIDAYARRDTGKNRDMIVGMMPPKLVQMMINLAISDEKNSENKKFIWNKKFEAEKNFWSEFTAVNERKNSHSNEEIWSLKWIYDPFCGLWTTLIEALNMGILKVAGSDLSVDMVNNSLDSVENFIHEELAWQAKIMMAGGTPNKDFSEVETDFFVLDATHISEAFDENELPRDINIVSEGFLGKIMKKHEMTQDMVFSERRAISRLYDKFFAELKKAKFSGNIVMSFPFWKVHNVYIFMDDISEIITKNGFTIESLLPREFDLNTKNGSLLYRRENQNVGREIIKIVKK